MHGAADPQSACLDRGGLLVVAQQDHLEAVRLPQAQQFKQLPGADPANFVQHDHAVAADLGPTPGDALEQWIQGADIQIIDAGAA
jgi:hypothetical protein